MAPFSDYLAGGVNDLRLKPRILRSLTRDLDDTGDRRSRLFDGEELANILEKVQLHGLLSEVLPEGYAGKDEAKLREEWRSAVDAWVERLLLLVSDKMPQKCWAGTCLLGVTIEECTSERLIASYSIWFEKLLQNIQASSNNRFIYEASYACLSDLFTRLSSFPNVKKESTSFSGRLVQPILQLLDDDGSFMEAAIDLLCMLIKFYPSAIYRCYDKVESALASKIMSGNSNMEVLKKISGALALLPHAKGDSGSWSVIMQKLMISINLLLNDVFEGLEEEGKGSEIMKLLVPAGMEAPPLWDQKNKPEGSTHATRRLRESISPLLYSLTYSCCVMLTNPYPVQVTIPVRPLLTLIGRVLNVDGTLVSKTVLPSTTSLYQELLCSELPTFHLYILDLLIATIKGLKSQLLPHAASVVQHVTDYFRRATLPSIRAKVYYTLELLLHSMGAGMSLYLAEHVIGNASIDLDEVHENICISKLGNEASLKGSPKKRKRGRSSSQSNGVEEETKSVIAGKKSAPLSVKIAALRAMETLLSVGGSLKSETRRLEADRLLINLATKSLDTFTGKAGKYLCIGESPTLQEEYCLVALQALLSSLLSPSHVRPPYLSQGLELFQKGKLEIGTEVATFCEKALLALEVLIHPRDIPLVNYPIPIAAVVSMNEFDDEEMHPGWWGESDDDGDTQPQSMDVDAQKSQGVEQERREDNKEAATSSFEPEKNESSSVLPPELGLGHTQAAVDQLPSQYLQNIGSDTKYAVSQDTVKDTQGKKSYYDLLGNNSLKGKELMNDSDSDSVPPVMLGETDTESD
ncbi:proline-, glutamic acid- and leucine-rich protein 1 [Carex littledalei]|uniref:Proline-, glutamic acid- and leucine-rich protein 1 n=1 Tax=Carex littledalei TaxID=544730 RepID=A0A833QJG8_9POAL|nr:proline-, glutamic acid- and leucine-rich protein 1 [Carex littledalei]